ncbi:hydrolase [Terrarubrum flagellatum]|uniref:hydrolase n=1 Tax=Terrirubrum flagellatum TaxID=2895980 RepID=UPI0031453233
MIELDPRSAALVLIDLQNGIVAMPLAPRTGAEIVAAGRSLAERFRAAGAPVVLVNVGWSADQGDMLRQPVDQAMARPPGGLPAGWSDLVDGLAQPGDIRITKRQWGAFHGTELDLQLRRRGVNTLVLGGIATNFGVEAVARGAYEHGYAVVVAEDAAASMSAEMHAFSIERIMPRISRVTRAAEIAFSKAA